MKWRIRVQAVSGATCILLLGCALTPPPAPVPRFAMPVSAGFDAVWDAVIDHFADSNIPIATIERASGLIASYRLDVGLTSGFIYADCGRSWQGPIPAEYAVYNVVARGDERAATLRVTALWSTPSAPFECSTRGVWEDQTERAIKAKAEGG